jgi:hypothetical protein
VVSESVTGSFQHLPISIIGIDVVAVANIANAVPADITGIPSDINTDIDVVAVKDIEGAVPAGINAIVVSELGRRARNLSLSDVNANIVAAKDIGRRFPQVLPLSSLASWDALGT